MTSQSSVPLLCAVIVARNEETLIAACIESVMHVGARFDGFEALLVDSRSTDKTVDIAARYPVTVVRIRSGVRCTAALARAIGVRLTVSRHVLFVDGDTVIDPEWVPRAVETLERQPDVAGVAGKLREVYYRGGKRVAETEDFFGTGALPRDVYQLGGNAVYRRAALEEVGSFHPGVVSHEEAELAGRLRAKGYRLVRLPLAVGTHHTGARDSWEECWRRFRSGLMVGQGQVLRLSIGTRLFWSHARALNRYLATAGFLALGFVCLVSAVVWRRVDMLLGWLGAATLMYAVFSLRSGSVRKPLGVLTDWILSVPGMAWGFTVGPFSVPSTIADQAELLRTGVRAGASIPARVNLGC